MTERNTERGSEQDSIDKAVAAAQRGILEGARRVQRTYRGLVRGDYGVKINPQSSGTIAFGAGLGAGLGLGVSLLARLHPAGRIAAMLAGAAGGALLGAVDVPADEDEDAGEAGPEAPAGRSNGGRPV